MIFKKGRKNDSMDFGVDVILQFICGHAGSRSVKTERFKLLFRVFLEIHKSPIRGSHITLARLKRMLVMRCPELGRPLNHEYISVLRISLYNEPSAASACWDALLRIMLLLSLFSKPTLDLSA